MLLGIYQKWMGIRKKKRIAAQVRAGIVPAGVSKEEIYEALRDTRPKNAMEMFGFLSAKHFDADGNLKHDYGVVGVKKITTPFAKYLVDALASSGAVINNFNYHCMGDGSGAEASGDAGMSEKVARAAGVNTHGSSSNIYSSLKTLAAGSAFTCIEHGMWNAATTSSGVLMDRTVLASSIPCATGDEIAFSYALTINSET